MTAIDVLRHAVTWTPARTEPHNPRQYIKEDDALADLDALVQTVQIVRDAHRYDTLNTEQAAAWLALSVVLARVLGEEDEA